MIHQAGLLKGYKMCDIHNKKAGIIGSGMIGTSLAALFTGNGIDVTVLTVGPEFTKQSKKKYDDIYKVLLERNLISQEQAKICAKRLKYTESYADLADTDILFECAVEDFGIKYEIYKQIERHCVKLEALASTTSALSADDLAKGLTKYKEKMVVAHPFNPPHLVPFVELVKSSHTDEKAAKLVYDFLEYCGRKVVTMQKGAPGFIANRLQHALLREAIYMVEQGYASPREIDKALMYSFMPRYTSVGLFEHQDAAGLDMVMNIQNYLFPDLSNAAEAPEFIAKRCKEGRFGQKAGEGVYKWTEKEKEDFQRRAAEPYWQYFNWNF